MAELRNLTNIHSTSINKYNRVNDVENHVDDEVALIGTNGKRKRSFLTIFGYFLVVLLIICVILVFLLLFYDRIVASPTETTNKIDNKNLFRFYHLVDFHLDLDYNVSWPASTYCHYIDTSVFHAKPTYDARYGRFGCDSPEILVNNSLSAVRAVNVTTGEDFDFVLASGDFVSHRKGYDSVLSMGISEELRAYTALTYTSKRLLATFPTRSVFPAIGNNDVIGDYLIPRGSRWYKKVFKLWSPLILCPSCPDHLRTTTPYNEIERTFHKGGYYKAELYDGKLIILSLNTLYWDIRALRSSDVPMNEMLDIARDQMDWLRDHLSNASSHGQAVIIQGHIPPGIDPFLRPTKKFLYYWLMNYTATYTHYVAGLYDNIIIGQFYAHLHRDDFRILTDGKGNFSFMLLAPSVSPIYYNNPAFRVIMVDKTVWKMVDWVQYYMDLGLANAYNRTKWVKAYQFSSYYPSKNKYIDTARMIELSDYLVNPFKVNYWLKYALARQVEYRMFSRMRFAYYCAIKFVQYGSFTKCLEEYPFNFVK